MKQDALEQRLGKRIVLKAACEREELVSWQNERRLLKRAVTADVREKPGIDINDPLTRPRGRNGSAR